MDQSITDMRARLLDGLGPENEAKVRFWWRRHFVRNNPDNQVSKPSIGQQEMVWKRDSTSARSRWLCVA